MRAGRRQLIAWADCEDEARALAAALTEAGLVGTRTRILVERLAHFDASSSSRGFSLGDFLGFLPPGTV